MTVFALLIASGFIAIGIIAAVTVPAIMIVTVINWIFRTGLLDRR